MTSGGTTESASAGRTPARARVQWPSIGLMLVGGMGLLSSFIALVVGVLNLVLTKEGIPPEFLNHLPPEIREHFVFYSGVTIGLLFVFFLLAGGIIYGGYHMLTLDRYRFAVAASILAVVPFFWSCFFLGVPVGLWAFLVLREKQVRRAFGDQSERSEPEAGSGR